MFDKLFGGKRQVLDVAEAAFKSLGFKYARVDEKTILSGVRAGDSAVSIILRNETGKSCLLVMSNGLPGATASALATLGSSGLSMLQVHSRAGYSSDQVAKVNEHMLKKNYEFSVGAFERDPSDGEVRFRIGLPYLDGQLTEEQIKVCIGLVVSAMTDFMREIERAKPSSGGLEL